MRKALIVGIDHYQNYKNFSSCACANDAKDISDILKKDYDNSPNFDVITKISTNDNVICKAYLQGDIKELFSGDADISLFYFSGHGYIDSTGGYIVTSDGKENDEGISMEYILKHATQSKAKDKIIILDCCYSGQFGSFDLCKRNSNIANLVEGMTILTACRNEEPATISHGHGLFTSLIIDALQGSAADLMGHITPGGIYAFIDRALGPWFQRPIFKTHVARFTSLRNAKPPISKEILRKIIEYFPNKNDEYKLDPSYEFDELSHIDENVKILKNLQAMERVGLVIPVGEEHMYYAAINSKSCKLTAYGHQYWRLVNDRRI